MLLSRKRHSQLKTVFGFLLNLLLGARKALRASSHRAGVFQAGRRAAMALLSRSRQCHSSRRCRGRCSRSALWNSESQFLFLLKFVTSVGLRCSLFRKWSTQNMNWSSVMLRTYWFEIWNYASLRVYCQQFTLLSITALLQSSRLSSHLSCLAAWRHSRSALTSATSELPRSQLAPMQNSQFDFFIWKISWIGWPFTINRYLKIFLK